MRLYRAAVLACGLAFGTPAALMADALNTSQYPGDMERGSAEPFGLPTTAVSHGDLSEMWRAAQRELDGEAMAIALCDEDPVRCDAPGALPFLAIVADGRAHDGRARLGSVNRAVNLTIRPGDDLALYGAVDVWRTPLALLAAGAGDCEDYAIAKLAALRAAGVAAEDLRMVILRDTLRQEDHAVAAARLDGRWLMLDNRRMAMVEDHRMQNVRPLFVIDHNGVRQYFDQRPLLSGAGRLKLALMAEQETTAAHEAAIYGRR
jgi:predicted transglutaminase-like cysteine proteinase